MKHAVFFLLGLTMLIISYYTIDIIWEYYTLGLCFVGALLCAANVDPLFNIIQNAIEDNESN